MTAENLTPAASAPAGGTRFNEAAADDRGKPSLLATAHAEAERLQ